MYKPDAVQKKSGDKKGSNPLSYKNVFSYNVDGQPLADSPAVFAAVRLRWHEIGMTIKARKPYVYNKNAIKLQPDEVVEVQAKIHDELCC